MQINGTGICKELLGQRVKQSPISHVKLLGVSVFRIDLMMLRVSNLSFCPVLITFREL